MEFFINVIISFLLGFIFSYLLDLNKRVKKLEYYSRLYKNQIKTEQRITAEISTRLDKRYYSLIYNCLANNKSI